MGRALRRQQERAARRQQRQQQQQQRSSGGGRPPVSVSGPATADARGGGFEVLCTRGVFRSTGDVLHMWKAPDGVGPDWENLEEIEESSTRQAS